MTGALFDRSNYSLITPEKTSLDVTDVRWRLLGPEVIAGMTHHAER